MYGTTYLDSDFNPHSREGNDGLDGDRSRLVQISIHTPAKGVTIESGWSGMSMGYFNPHSREGSDLSILTTSKQLEHFNPHSREGSDASGALQTFAGFLISIHTPAKGVTRWFSLL